LAVDGYDGSGLKLETIGQFLQVFYLCLGKIVFDLKKLKPSDFAPFRLYSHNITTAVISKIVLSFLGTCKAITWVQNIMLLAGDDSYIKAQIHNFERINRFASKKWLQHSHCRLVNTSLHNKHENLVLAG